MSDIDTLELTRCFKACVHEAVNDDVSRPTMAVVGYGLKHLLDGESYLGVMLKTDASMPPYGFRIRRIPRR